MMLLRSKGIPLPDLRSLPVDLDCVLGHGGNYACLFIESAVSEPEIRAFSGSLGAAIRVRYEGGSPEDNQGSERPFDQPYCRSNANARA
jgi:hypothetical protein